MTYRASTGSESGIAELDSHSEFPLSTPSSLTPITHISFILYHSFDMFSDTNSSNKSSNSGLGLYSNMLQKLSEVQRWPEKNETVWIEMWKEYLIDQIFS